MPEGSDDLPLKLRVLDFALKWTFRASLLLGAYMVLLGVAKYA